MKRSSRQSASSFADTANGDPFAVFEIIADIRRIRNLVSNPDPSKLPDLCKLPDPCILIESRDLSDLSERARRIEMHADGMIKTILGTADLSTVGIPTPVIEQIVDLLRRHRSQSTD